jgi:microcystin-dependent protein
MKTLMRRSISTTLLLSAFGGALWSPSSFACDAEPYIGSICVMALARNYGFGNGQYIPAAGQQLNINQNAALYALIGNTYGGDAVSNFKLPDLRGKVVVGYDERVAAQPIGTTGGAASVNLSVAQLPQHAFTITNAPVTLSGLSATTTLTGLSGTADLSNVVLSGPASGLVIKASSQSGLNTPSGNFIGKGNGSQGNNYTASTPDVTLNSGSIAGNLSMTVNSGTKAPVAVSGTAATTVSGNGSVSATTNSLGSGAAVGTMPPYLVMTYYIAIRGLYPSQD